MSNSYEIPQGARLKLGALRWLGAATCFVAVCAFPVATFARTPPRVEHGFVALADHQHQGIVPVAAFFGN